MLQIMCWVDSEDYWYLHSINEKDQSVDFYAYKFVVEGGSESTGGSGAVKLLVVELISAKMAVGFVISNDFQPKKDITLRFICNESPSKDIAVECKMSEEVKKASYMGNDLEKIEYIGFTLEKFYENNNAKFYLNDLRPQSDPGEQGGQP